MSINPSAGLLYVASGDSFWFNIVNTTTHKVIGVNTQISYPVASVVNNITGRVFVAECLECDDLILQMVLQSTHWIVMGPLSIGIHMRILTLRTTGWQSIHSQISCMR